MLQKRANNLFELDWMHKITKESDFVNYNNALFLDYTY